MPGIFTNFERQTRGHQKIHGRFRTNCLRLPAAALLLLAAGSASGQDTLSLASGSVAAGQTVSLDLSLTAPASGGPAGLEWTYSYPASTFSSVSVAAGPAAVAAGKSVSCSGGSGSYTCMLFGLNSLTLSSGVVATATFTTPAAVASTSSSIQILNSTGVTLGDSAVSVTATGGQVNVISPYTVTGMTCSPAMVTIPGSAACSVALSAPAPVGGLTVTTGVASGASVTIPPSVVVPAGSNSANFTVSVAAGSSSTAVAANVSAAAAKTAVLSASLNGTSQNFTLTLTSPPPASIAASAGTPQTATVSTAFAAGLQAIVKDASNNPVSGVTVTFTAPGSGASATFAGSATAAALTNASGIAVSPVPVANAVAGAYSVSAAAPGLTPVTFALTNTVAVSSPGSATFVKMDTTTQGNWKSVYGKDGYNVILDGASNPSYVTPAASGQSNYTWAASTSSARALQKATNPADRIAATWFANSPFTIDMNIGDTATHQVALYFLDWDSTARREKIDVLNASGTVLNTQTLTSSFNGGIYLLWNVSGHVKFRITPNAGANAVVSGLFFDAPTSSAATATFVKMDATTQGNWKSVYGPDGYNVIADGTSNPSYVTPAVSGQLTTTWAASSSDPRALQRATNPAGRIAACWHSTAPFTIDMNISDTATHQVAMYFLDWDSTTRRQTVTVLDANGTVLNTQALTSSFNAGVYLIWNVSGHVQFRITPNGGANAVVSGLFFEP